MLWEPWLDTVGFYLQVSSYIWYIADGIVSPPLQSENHSKLVFDDSVESARIPQEPGIQVSAWFNKMFSPRSPLRNETSTHLLRSFYSNYEHHSSSCHVSWIQLVFPLTVVLMDAGYKRRAISRNCQLFPDGFTSKHLSLYSILLLRSY